MTQMLFWEMICVHEGSSSECEKLLKKINVFEILPHENANDMYSCLNVLVE
jgi:hypothetical protein